MDMIKIALKFRTQNGRAMEKLDPYAVVHLRCMGTRGLERLIRALENLKRILDM